MKILSLFDGMACGMLAMQRAGIEVDRYVAYEIDKYAVQTSSHNFPMIEHRGDVFQADFTEYSDFDFLVGGSPCTYWSIAQKNNRETEASGMGWELFSQYVRALHEAKPRFFIYENNKSMSKAIRASIDEAFGFEAIGINSALVSAQNRQRLYWVGKRNQDGTYSKVKVEQPEDRGILLKHILETGCDLTCNEKSYCLTASYDGACAWNTIERSQRSMVVEPVGIGYRGRMEDGKWVKRYESNEEPRANALTTCQTDSMVATPVAEPVSFTMSGTFGSRRASVSDKAYCLAANPSSDMAQRCIEPVNTTADGKAQCLRATCYKDGIRNMVGNDIDKKTCVAEPISDRVGAETGLYAIPCRTMPVREATKKGYTEIEPMDCVDLTQPNSKTRRGRNMADKSNCCMTSCQHYQYCGVLGYATPCEWDEEGNVTKAISATDGKTYAVYKVENGEITIKGKRYPIKLVDGIYIIRKLTVTECKRLQTVPEWYEFPVSDTQAYKMLGNGWTVEVIAHLINATQADEQEEEQIDLFAVTI